MTEANPTVSSAEPTGLDNDNHRESNVSDKSDQEAIKREATL